MAKRICSIPDCTAPVSVQSRGWCKRHYTRWWRYGDPLAGGPPRDGLFWTKVDKGDGTGCWLWLRGSIKGYGSFYDPQRRKRVYAHRYAYEDLVGPIPDGYELDHVRANGCMSTLCVKAIADEHGPAHLEPVTRAENARREFAPRRVVCPKGHPYDEANTYINPANSGWYCRTCSRERERERRRLASHSKRPI